jgi:hypothetical protein
MVKVVGMAIRWISSAWRTSLTSFPWDRRVYLDFRQQNYPEIAGSPTFTLITSADNQPGSHNLTGGYASYLMDMPTKMTLDFYFKPTFSYTGGSNQYLWSWYIDATHQLSFYFDVTSHKYTLTWQDGGTARTMLSSAYASDVAFQVWTRASFSLDLTTGSTAGSAFYLQGASVATAWSGNIDAKAHYFPVLSIRGQATTAGTYTVNYVRMFSGITSTATEVSANFSAKKDEEIVWHYNGHAVGHTRCNVTSRVRNLQMTRSVESGGGNPNSNSVSIVLMSTVGQFADEQYAAFAPSSEIYNGTSSQKYMQTHCPVEIETWYSNLFELEFVGHVDDNLFRRHSVVNDVSIVTISAQDSVEWMQRSVAQVAYTYENYDLSKPGDYSTSLLHTIARLNSRKSWYNYLGNSSFENATIGNSWLVAGAGASIAKVAGGLIGSNQCDLTYGAATASIYQTVTFSTVKKLDTQQNWNFSIYLKSAGAASGTLRISGYTSGVETEFQTTNWSLSGGEGWRKFDVSYTVATSTVNRIRCTVTSSATISLDCAMLIPSKIACNWFALNSTDGAAGVISADSAMAAQYDSLGFDTDDAPITHPWVLVKQNDPIWSHLIDIHDATAAYYLGMDACGTLKYRTPFKTAYGDPASTLTVTNAQSVDAVMDIEQANHIIINGVAIYKSTDYKIIWNAKNANAFQTVYGADIYETVNSGDSWPNPSVYPEFWAVYSESN